MRTDEELAARWIQRAEELEQEAAGLRAAAERMVPTTPDLPTTGPEPKKNEGA